MKQLAGRGGGFFVGGKRMRGFGLGPPGEILHWGPPGGKPLFFSMSLEVEASTKNETFLLKSHKNS